MMNSYAIAFLGIFLCGLCMVSALKDEDSYNLGQFFKLAKLRGVGQNHHLAESKPKNTHLVGIYLNDRTSNLHQTRTRSSAERPRRSMGGFPVHYGTRVDNCPRPENNICLLFNVSQSQLVNLLKAELWVKHRGEQAGDAHELVVWSPSKPDVRALVKPHWIKFDVAQFLNEWSSNPNQPQMMVVSCQGCGVNQLNSPLLTEGEDRPMLSLLSF